MKAPDLVLVPPRPTSSGTNAHHPDLTSSPRPRLKTGRGRGRRGPLQTTSTAAPIGTRSTDRLLERWRAPKGWPGNARAVTQLLRRQAPPMRKAGWTATDDDACAPHLIALRLVTAIDLQNDDAAS